MKQFYKLSIVVLCLGGAVHSQAQEQSSSFTLDQCIQYALENSLNVKNALVDQEIARARVKETRGIGLPQIEGTVGVQHNQKLPRFYAMKQTAYGFSGLSDPTSANYVPYTDFYPSLADNDVIASQNFFQLKSNGNASVTINQILFNGSYLVGLKAANSYKDLSVKAAGQSKEQTALQVSKAYYLAITNTERIKLFDSNIGRVDTLLRNTRALNKNGFAESIDVDRIQVTYNNLVTERAKFENLQLVAIELLKFQMGYPMDQSIALAGTIEEFKAPDLAVADELDYNKRWDYQVLRANKKLQELDVKNQYAAGMPSLVAFANLGYSTQSPTIGGVFKTNSDIESTDAVGPDKWYGFSLFGASLNIPIFSGLQRTYKVQQAKLSLMKIENNTRLLESSIQLEAKQARSTLDNAIKSLNAQKENMDLATNVARVTKIKYEQGVGSNIEVIDAETSLRESQTNYYNALYDALVAKVDLDKAYGKLLPTTSNENK